MSAMTTQITSLTIVYSTFYSRTDERKLRVTALAFVAGIHRWPVNSPHKGPLTRKMFPFDDVFMDTAERLYPCVPGRPFPYHGLTLVPALISIYIRYEMWDEITYPFANFNGATAEVWG